MTSRETPRSSSCVSAKRPLRKACTSLAACAVIVLLQTLVGRADATACNMTVTNLWNVSVYLQSFDDTDYSCSSPYANYNVLSNESTSNRVCVCVCVCVPLFAGAAPPFV
jgi:hypothetical protein